MTVNHKKINGKNIIRNAYAFSIISKFFGIFAGVVYSVLFNRYLGASLRGEAAIILNYVSLLTIPLCMGTYQAYPFYKKKGEKDLYSTFIANMYSLFFLYAGMATLFALFTPYDMDLKIAVMILPLAVMVKEFNYIVLIENPYQRNVASMMLNILDILLISAFFVTTTANYVYLLSFLVIKEVIYFGVAIHNLGINVFLVKPRIQELGKYIKYGIIPMFTVMLMTINYNIDVFMLNGRVPKVQIGIYSLGATLANYLWLLPDALKDILLSKLAKGNDKSEVAKIIRVSLAISLAFVLGMVLFGRFIIAILYGPEYAGAYEVTVILLTGVVGMIFYKMVYSYNVIHGRRAINLVFLGISAILNVFGNLLLIPNFGIHGSAFASVVSYLLCGIMFLVYFHRESGIAYKEILFINKNDLKQAKKLLF